MFKRIGAVLLSGGLTFFSAGLEPWQAAAAQLAPRSSAGGHIVPVSLVAPHVALNPLATIPALGLQKIPLSFVPSPALTSSLSPAAALPQTAAAAQGPVTPFQNTMSRLQAPSALEGVTEQSSGETSRNGAEKDFGLRIGESYATPAETAVSGESAKNTTAGLKPASRRAVRATASAAFRRLLARRAEGGSAKALPEVRVPVLERVLRQAQLSLRLGQPYDVLVLNSDSRELLDPKVYGALSGGKARVETLNTPAPQDVLGETRNLGRYGAVVLGKPFELLPVPGQPDDRRLRLALKQLDSLFVLATRLAPQAGAGFKTGSAENLKYQELGEQAVRLDRRDRKQVEAFEKLIKQFWREIAANRLKGMPVSSLIENLYKGMRNKGIAFLSFGPTDPGLSVWERLLRYWEAEDGGRFRVTRVDLENGGHIFILRKIESRVGLWLKPLNGDVITTSVPNASASPEGRAAARQALLTAGFEKHLEKFDSLDVDVRHVFGADVGRQEVYVTIPRRNAGAIRGLVSGASVDIRESRTDFQPHLIGSAELHGVKPVWKMGVTGEGGTILWIDTGADATHEDFQGRLDAVDMVNEGPEDWIGHGTHVAGISISGGQPYTGMARAARGIMAKVFSRESPGASDGDIMASAAMALQKGVDVINLSLGSRGSSSDNLAVFFSELTKQKNSKGELMFVTASAGNSGPFDQSLSQPSAGEEVNATAAAAVGEDDGIPEISFYSSVGPDLDKRYAVKRLRLKPDETVKGGDVTTQPGSGNVYRRGIYSAKSKDMAKGPSDTEDGRHTGMSGTSMASPMLAGIALLVKLAIRATGAETPWLKENLPVAIKAILMRTADDMKVPVWYQGAGFANAYAAVKLIASMAGSSLRNGARRFWSRLGGRSRFAAASSDPWQWVVRYRSVIALEDKVYAQAELAKTNAQAQFDEGATEDPEAPLESRRAAGNAVHAEMIKKFNAAREEVLPEVIAALKDPVWLVRRQAAFTLLNLKASGSAMPLAEAALKDEDGRVRQMAFLALAEIRTRAVDVLLQKACADERGDVGIYAAYALARHGDRGGVGRIVSELAHQDKWARFSAVWLLGQLGARASSVEAQALSGRVKDGSERGNIRHMAAAALSNIAEVKPAAIPDAAVSDLYEAAGPQNLALTRTIAKVFPMAFRNKAFVARMKEGSLREMTAAFILKNKAAVSKPGALGELVSLLARVINMPLDQPTGLPDPNGAGVLGVDPVLGPLDLLIELKAGAARPDQALLARFGVELKADLPLSGALWVSVPEPKLFAFNLEMRRAGHNARLSTAKYTASRRVGAEPFFPGLTIDVGRDPIAISHDADLSLVRLTAAAGVSEARIMAALEAIAARAGDPLKKPVVVVVAMGGPGAAHAPLTRLIDRLILGNIGVVVPAGNEGPAENTISSLAKSNLAVVVAAAGRTQGLAGYSARGRPSKPSISWTDVVDDLRPDLPSLSEVSAAAARLVMGLPAAQPAGAQSAVLGTGAAAESTAGKLAGLARRLAESLFAAKGRLPDGYFLYLLALVKQTLTPMPKNYPHEVGAGLFDQPDRARQLLERKLAEPDRLWEEAQALAEKARARLKGVFD